MIMRRAVAVVIGAGSVIPFGRSVVVVMVMVLVEVAVVVMAAGEVRMLVSATVGGVPLVAVART